MIWSLEGPRCNIEDLSVEQWICYTYLDQAKSILYASADTDMLVSEAYRQYKDVK